MIFFKANTRIRSRNLLLAKKKIHLLSCSMPCFALSQTVAPEDVPHFETFQPVVN